MQSVRRFIVAGGFVVLTVGVVALESVAQTNAPPTKVNTRLITLGTVAGPPPRANRAQFSNLLIVDGTLYVVDAGDGVTRRIAQAVLMFAMWALFSSPIIMMITQLAWGP